MLETEALEFVEEVILPVWPRWKPSHYEKLIWAKKFKPFSYSDAQAGFERYYTSQDYTIQRPKPEAVLRHLTSTDGKIRDYVWIQNTKNGVFHEHYIQGDREKVLFKLFQDDGAPFGDGNWKAYDPGEITHDELFEFRMRKNKGLISAIENLESEEEAAYIVETYMVDPRSRPAKDIKKRLHELKDKKNRAKVAEFMKLK